MTMRTIDFTKARTKREKLEMFSQARILLMRMISRWSYEPGPKYPENWRPEQRKRKWKKFR